MLSIAILDDDRKILNEYEKHIPVWLKRNGIKGSIVIATTDYKQFMTEIRDQIVNLCILDVNLKSEVNGMYIAKCIRKENIKTEIIFSTGLLEYMPQAFDVNAYNFITKPINNSLEKSLIKLSKEIDNKTSIKKIIEIKFGTHIYFVPHEEIVYLQRIGTKTIISTQNHVLEVYDSLEALAEKLNNNHFRQCHRSIIINTDYIDYIDIKHKCISLKNGVQCEIGPKYYSNFKSKNEWSESSVC